MKNDNEYLKQKNNYLIAKYKFMIEQIKKNPHPIYAADRLRILNARITKYKNEL